MVVTYAEEDWPLSFTAVDDDITVVGETRDAVIAELEAEKVRRAQ